MMNDLTHPDMHRPTEAFRDYMEGEVSRAFRRERLLPRLRLAAAIVISLAIGATAGLASAQVRDGAQRDSLLEAAQADAMLVSVRLDLARAQLAEARRAAAVGATSSESTSKLELQVRDMEAQFGRAGLNIAEIKASKNAPRDELNAPLVNGRDFMKDRLNLRLMVAQQQLQSAQIAQGEAARRVRTGVASELSTMEADVDVAKAMRDLAVLADRLVLRKEFLAKGTPVEALTQRLDQSALRQDVYVAQRELDLARARAALLEKRHAVGAAGDLEVMKANVELKEREIELQRLARRFKGD